MDITEDIGAKRLSKKAMKVANITAVGYFWTILALDSYTTLFVTLPYLYRNNTQGYWRQILILFFIVINLLLNYFLSVCTKSSLEGADPSPVPRSWSHCLICQKHTPPRTHHCPICGTCILKRDQHCFFLGKCTGYFNQRYFVVYIFYTAVGTIYFLSQTIAYLHYQHGPFFYGETMFDYIFPITLYRLITGSILISNFFLVVLVYLCLSIAIFAATMFIWQMINIHTGQTAHEAKSDIHTFDFGPRENYVEVFGHYWLLCFLVPAFLPLHGNGKTWKPQSKIVKRY